MSKNKQKNTANVAENNPLIKAIDTMVQHHGFGKASKMIGISKHLLRQIINGSTVIRCKNTHLCSALDDLMEMRKELVDLVAAKDYQITSVTGIIVKHLLN